LPAPEKQIKQIRPHGGRLINRLVEGEKKENLIERAQSLPRIQLNNRELADLEMIAVGAMSPLEGFMTRDDYEGVLSEMHLSMGLPWTLPITLAVKPGDDADQYKEGLDVALEHSGNILGVLHLEEKYKVDKNREAKTVLLTDDEAHPGVQYLGTIGDVYLGGEISVFGKPEHAELNNYRLDPKETRVLFKAKGWSTIVAFQTRNPIHRAHEYLQKSAMEIVDGLLIHPLVGETKKGDIPADVRMDCYNVLLDNYYPRDRVALHFIVGRDHAGVGDYYGTYDAQYIFNEFTRDELDVTPLFFEHAFFCTKCGNMASQKTCPHGNEDHIFLSGTKVREMLGNGQMPPETFTRPEVAKVLMDAYAKEE
jgi:sulfate adenylyltransferase